MMIRHKSNIEHYIVGVPSMKKYQLWLQRKSYSQHLFNLLKIKYTHPPTQKRQPRHMRHNTAKEKLNTQPSPHHLSPAQQNCYFNQSALRATFDGASSKESRSRRGPRSSPMKAFDLKNSNANLAKRIKEVKSVVNLKKDRRKPVNMQQFERRKRVERRYDSANEEIRHENFKRFQLWNQSTNSSFYKYEFAISILDVSALFRTRTPQEEAWCEVVTEKKGFRSKMANLHHNVDLCFHMQFQQALPKFFDLKLYKSRGLTSEAMGIFRISRPEEGQLREEWLWSQTHKCQIHVEMGYESVQNVRPLLNQR